jgi:tetratricopeptide (TPR) repeat protein
MKQGEFRQAIAVLDEDIRNGKNLYASYKLRADLKSMTGDFAGAVADLDKLIAMKPEDGESYQRRAELRMTSRADMADVLADLDQAIVHGVKQEKVYRLRGFIRSSRGDLDGAIADYQSAMGLDPRYASAYQGLASIYLRKGDRAKAIETLEGFVVSVESADKKPKVVKGAVVASTSVEVPAMTEGQMNVRRDTIITSGTSRMSGPPTREQMEKMSERMEQSKNTALVYATLADLYNQRGDHQLALETANKSLAIDPTDFVAYSVLGRVKTDLGDLTGAIADLGRSISMNPHNGLAFLDRGIAYLMLGKEAEAQKDFDKYLEMVPAGKTFLDRRVEAARNKLKN